MVSRRLISTVAGAALLLPGGAFAHSSVSPEQTVTSKYENFSLSVPAEKEVPTVAIRLVMPPELDRVTPVVKPGWTLKVTKDESGKVTELSWTGGSIPAGQKDIFAFTARTPATSTALAWKAYQTYRGGEVAAWDQDPAHTEEHGEGVVHPYSVTQVAAPEVPTGIRWDLLSPLLSLVALVLSIAALTMAWRRPYGV